MAMSYYILTSLTKNMNTQLHCLLLSNSCQPFPFLIPSSNFILRVLEVGGSGDTCVEPLAGRSIQGMGLFKAAQRRRNARGGHAATTIGVSNLQ